MNINASMIREARMIYQHLFNQGPSTASSPRRDFRPDVLLCSSCLYIKPKRANRAVTIRDGSALCLDHVS